MEVPNLRDLAFTRLVQMVPIPINSVWLEEDEHLSYSNFDVTLPNNLRIIGVRLRDASEYVCLSCKRLVSTDIRKWSRHQCRHPDDISKPRDVKGSIPTLRKLSLHSVIDNEYEKYSRNKDKINNMPIRVHAIHFEKDKHFLSSKFEVVLPNSYILKDVYFIPTKIKFCRSCKCVIPDRQEYHFEHNCWESWEDPDSDFSLMNEEGCTTFMVFHESERQCDEWS